MLTFGSLFAGIGGFDLGLEWAGMKCEWQVEYDSYCNKILEKHWPDVPRYGDIKEIDPSALTPVDVICGGFPCQPVSIIGKGLAQDDERWLWPEFCRIVRGVRPKYVLVENVSGLLGRGLGDVLGDLASIGYDAEWQSIPASAVGAPHLRYRVWVFAWDRTGRRQGDVADSDRCSAPERGQRPSISRSRDERGNDGGGSNGHSGEIAVRGAGQDSGSGIIESLLADAIQPGLEGLARDGDGEAGRQVQDRPTGTGGVCGGTRTPSDVADSDRPPSWAGLGEGRSSHRIGEPCRSGRSCDGCSSSGEGSAGGGYEEIHPLARAAVRSSRDSGRGGIFGDHGAGIAFIRSILRDFSEGHWATEPDVGRVADGIPNRVDRIKALGNAVVPQNAYFLGMLVSAFDEMTR